MNDTTSSQDTSIPSISPAEISNEGFFRQAQNEFEIFMLPCYIFIVIASYRIIKLRKATPDYIDGPVYNSYHLKRKLSLLNAIIYVLQLFFTLISSKESYWAADYKGQAFISYSLGVLSWYLSAKFLEEQVPRGLPLDFWSQKVFWPAHFVMAIIKIISPLEVNIWVNILSICKIVVGAYLTMYAIAKPCDSEESELKVGTRSNFSLLRKYLDNLDDLIAKKIFGGFEGFLLPTRKDSNVYVEEFKNYVQKKNPHMPLLAGHSSTTPKPYQVAEQAQAPKLPKIKCQVSQNIDTRDKGDDDIKIFYEVKTQVGNKTFKKLHKYANFLDLDLIIRKKCEINKTPWLTRSPPMLTRIDFDDYEDEKAFIEARIKGLEAYMNELVSDPKYVIDKVVEFLGFPDEDREPFAIYQSSLRISYPKSRALQYFTPGIELKNFARAQSGSATPKMPMFKAYCSQYSKIADGSYEFEFVLIDENNNQAPSWRIRKTHKDFRIFNEKLEGELNRALPFFNEYVPKPQSLLNESSVVEMKKGLEKYVDIIVGHKQYYKGILYEFVDYDLDRGLSSRSGSVRESFYGESVSNL